LLKNDLDYFVFFVEKREIKATDILEFYRKHEKKIEDAFNYFRMNNFHPCLILARACGQTSDVEDVEWRDVVVDLPADTEARLSIFYSDFVYDSNQNPVIEGLPDAEPKMLQKTTEQLEVATKGLPI
jgi:U3 small nucleolar ribonucleoprotein component